MPPAVAQHTVSTALTRILLAYISGEGHSPVAICNRAGIAPALPTDPEARLSGAQFEALWNEAARTADDPDFGLHFGHALGKSRPGGNFLFNLMMCCPTAAEAMDCFLRYHDILADAIRPQLAVDPDRAVIYWDYFGPDLDMPSQLGEGLLNVYTSMLRRLTDDTLVIQEVRFTSPRPRTIDLHNRIFRAPLSFAQPRNELIFAADFLDLPIPWANAEMQQTLEQHAQRLLERLFVSNALSSQVAMLLGKRLVRGEAIGVELVAKHLGMSMRSLQGKLKQEGASYQKLLDEVRKKLAMSYLKKPDTTICDVAFLLGYSEQSAFNHAFKRWTGVAPRGYRRGER